MVKNLPALGKTVLLTTHYMDEAQYLADRVAIIAAGEIVAEGPTVDGRRTRPRSARVVRFRSGGRAPPAHRRGQVGRPTTTLESDGRPTAARCTTLTGWAIGAGVDARGARGHAAVAEDAYLELTGGGGRAAVSAVGLIAATGPVHEQGVLAEPGVGVLHVRVPADVPGDLHGAVRRGDGPRSGKELSQATYYVPCDRGVLGDHRVLHEHRDQRDVRAGHRGPEADPGDAAARVGLRRGSRDACGDRGSILVAIVAAFGRVFYDVTPAIGRDPVRFLVTLVVGAASFAALGLALTCVIPNADAAPAVVNATVLPLLFLSGVFIPVSQLDARLDQHVGNLFPIRHFVIAMNAAFLAFPAERPVRSWSDVAYVALWGIAGLLLAARYFSWEPRT